MRRMLAEYRTFLREFYRNFHTTGALLPSGRSLAAALARYVRAGSGPRRILEVGPGTGAVTRWVAEALGDDDRLDLVELNETFVRRLNHRFEHDPAFRRVAQRSTVLHRRIEDLPEDKPYEVIVSGLPLNNFSVRGVEEVLDALFRHLAPGGVLSFFEYVAVRPARSLVSGRNERTRLRGIGRTLGKLLDAHEIRRELILPNVPPAWVHHVQRPEAAAPRD